MPTRLLAFARSLVQRRRIDQEIDEELAFHLAQETDANVARGMSEIEASRAARLNLGGHAQTREAVRAVRLTIVDSIWRDVRYAVRSLRMTPAFTLVALAVLALSIGATTAIFSIVDGVVLRPLPFPRADRLVFVGERRVKAASDDPRQVAPQNFLDWRVRQRSFAGLAAIGYASISLRADNGEEPETLEAKAVTANLFTVLGVAPLMGRPFTGEHETGGRARVAVISYGLWQRRLGGRPDVIGEILPGQRGNFEILAVMPPGFGWPVGASRPVDVWIPAVFSPEEHMRGDSFAYRLDVIARLRDGVTVDMARADMQRITAELATETPRWFRDRVASVDPLRDYLAQGVRPWLLMLLAAVGLVLLIAIVNLANLVLVRVSARNRELVIRSALGASRLDLVRALVTESLVLSSVGAALGALMAWSSVGVLRAALPTDVPRVAGIAVDLRVLAATVSIAIASGLAFSATPALLFSRPSGRMDIGGIGRANTTGPRHGWLRGALVTVEAALAVVLLIGAGLFLVSFARVARVNVGLDPHDVLTVRVPGTVGPQSPPAALERNRGLLGGLLERVRAIPGIEVAAWTSGGLPFRGDLRTIDFAIPGRELPPNEDLDFSAVSPDYFRAVRTPVLAGRAFTDADRRNSEPVVIVSEAMARHYFAGGRAIGNTIDFAGRRRIVGIVGNVRHDGPEAEWRRQGFIPLAQSEEAGGTLVLRLARETTTVLPAVKAAIWSTFPGLALPEITTLSQYLDALVAQRRFNMMLLGVFGVLGIVIACVGIYGVLAYVVLLRTPEIGVRMALGATPYQVRRSVLAHASIHLGAGLTIGLASAWMLSALVARFLFEVRPHDPWIYLGAAAALAASGLAAAFVPAWRASRIDPATTLRAM